MRETKFSTTSSFQKAASMFFVKAALFFYYTLNEAEASSLRKLSPLEATMGGCSFSEAMRLQAYYMVGQKADFG